MKLLRLFVLVAFAGVCGWLVYRSVSVESTDEKVQITIDKQKLKEAGRDLEDRGRQAADKVGQALEQAGHKLDADDPPRQAPESASRVR
jgi:hypothetical protein